MSEVLTGKGPQPPVVYWIRRLLVLVVAVIVVGSLVWAFMPKGEPPAAGVPADTPSAAPSESAAPSDSPSGGDLPTTSPSSAPSGSAEVEACEPIGVQLDLIGFRSVKSGGKQTFSVTAENNTTTPCVMEITQATFVLRVVSGTDAIFSTAHCDMWLPEVQTQTLAAGATVEFKVAWTTFRSAQGCKQAKALLGAGTYVATAAYKETATDRFAFLLTAP